MAKSYSHRRSAGSGSGGGGAGAAAAAAATLPSHTSSSSSSHHSRRMAQLEAKVQYQMDAEDRRVKQLTEGILYDFLPAALAVMLPEEGEQQDALDPVQYQAVAGAALSLSALMNAPPGFLEFLLCIPWRTLQQGYPTTSATSSSSCPHRSSRCSSPAAANGAHAPAASTGGGLQLELDEEERRRLVNTRIHPTLMAPLLDFLYQPCHAASVPAVLQLSSTALSPLYPAAQHGGLQQQQQQQQDPFLQAPGEQELTLEGVAALLDGATPLHCAALRGNPAQVDHLIYCGADPSLRTAAGELPLQLVPVCGHQIGASSKRVCRCLAAAEQEVWECRSRLARGLIARRCLSAVHIGLCAWLRLVLLALVVLMGCLPPGSIITQRALSLKPQVQQHLQVLRRQRREQAEAQVRQQVEQLRAAAAAGRKHLDAALQLRKSGQLKAQPPDTALGTLAGGKQGCADSRSSCSLHMQDGSNSKVPEGPGHLSAPDTSSSSSSSSSNRAQVNVATLWQQELTQAQRHLAQAVHVLQQLQVQPNRLPAALADGHTNDQQLPLQLCLGEDEQAQLYSSWAECVLLKFKSCSCAGCTALAVHAVALAHQQLQQLHESLVQQRRESEPLLREQLLIMWPLLHGPAPPPHQQPLQQQGMQQQQHQQQQQGMQQQQQQPEGPGAGPYPPAPPPAAQQQQRPATAEVIAAAAAAAAAQQNISAAQWAQGVALIQRSCAVTSCFKAVMLAEIELLLATDARHPVTRTSLARAQQSLRHWWQLQQLQCLMEFCRQSLEGSDTSSSSSSTGGDGVCSGSGSAGTSSDITNISRSSSNGVEMSAAHVGAAAAAAAAGPTHLVPSQRAVGAGSMAQPCPVPPATAATAPEQQQQPQQQQTQTQQPQQQQQQQQQPQQQWLPKVPHFQGIQWPSIVPVKVEPDVPQILQLQLWVRAAECDVTLVEAMCGYQLAATEQLAGALAQCTCRAPNGRLQLRRPVNAAVFDQLQAAQDLATAASPAVAAVAREVLAATAAELAAASALQELPRSATTVHTQEALAAMGAVVESAAAFPRLQQGVEAAQQLYVSCSRRVAALGELQAVMSSIQAGIAQVTAAEVPQQPPPPTAAVAAGAPGPGSTGSGSGALQPGLKQLSGFEVTRWQQWLEELQGASEAAKQLDVTVDQAKRLAKELNAQMAAVEVAAAADLLLAKVPAGSAALKAMLLRLEAAAAAINPPTSTMGAAAGPASSSMPSSSTAVGSGGSAAGSASSSSGVPPAGGRTGSSEGGTPPPDAAGLSSSSSEAGNATATSTTTSSSSCRGGNAFMELLSSRVQLARRRMEVEKAAEQLHKAAFSCKCLADLPRLEAAILNARKLGAEELDPEGYSRASDQRVLLSEAARGRAALEAAMSKLSRGGRVESADGLEAALQEASRWGALLGPDLSRAREALESWRSCTVSEAKLSRALREGSGASQLARAIQEAASSGVQVAAAKRVLKLMQALDLATAAAAASAADGAASASAVPAQSTLRAKIEAAEQGGVSPAVVEPARRLLKRLLLQGARAALESALGQRSEAGLNFRVSLLKRALAQAEAALGVSAVELAVLQEGGQQQQVETGSTKSEAGAQQQQQQQQRQPEGDPGSQQSILQEQAGEGVGGKQSSGTGFAGAGGGGGDSGGGPAAAGAGKDVRVEHDQQQAQVQVVNGSSQASTDGQQQQQQQQQVLSGKVPRQQAAAPEGQAAAAAAAVLNAGADRGAPGATTTTSKPGDRGAPGATTTTSTPDDRGAPGAMTTSSIPGASAAPAASFLPRCYSSSSSLSISDTASITSSSQLLSCSSSVRDQPTGRGGGKEGNLDPLGVADVEGLAAEVVGLVVCAWQLLQEDQAEVARSAQARAEQERARREQQEKERAERQRQDTERDKGAEKREAARPRLEQRSKGRKLMWSKPAPAPAPAPATAATFAVNGDKAGSSSGGGGSSEPGAASRKPAWVGAEFTAQKLLGGRGGAVATADADASGASSAAGAAAAAAAAGGDGRPTTTDSAPVAPSATAAAAAAGGGGGGGGGGGRPSSAAAAAAAVATRNTLTSSVPHSYARAAQQQHDTAATAPPPAAAAAAARANDGGRGVSGSHSSPLTPAAAQAATAAAVSASSGATGGDTRAAAADAGALSHHHQPASTPQSDGCGAPGSAGGLYGVGAAVAAACSPLCIGAAAAPPATAPPGMYEGHVPDSSSTASSIQMLLSGWGRAAVQSAHLAAHVRTDSLEILGDAHAKLGVGLLEDLGALDLTGGHPAGGHPSSSLPPGAAARGVGAAAGGWAAARGVGAAAGGWPCNAAAAEAAAAAAVPLTQQQQQQQQQLEQGGPPVNRQLMLASLTENWGATGAVAAQQLAQHPGSASPHPLLDSSDATGSASTTLSHGSVPLSRHSVDAASLYRPAHQPAAEWRFANPDRLLWGGGPAAAHSNLTGTSAPPREVRSVSYSGGDTFSNAPTDSHGGLLAGEHAAVHPAFQGLTRLTSPLGQSLTGSNLPMGVFSPSMAGQEATAGAAAALDLAGHGACGAAAAGGGLLMPSGPGLRGRALSDIGGHTVPSPASTSCAAVQLCGHVPYYTAHDPLEAFYPPSFHLSRAAAAAAGSGGGGGLAVLGGGGGGQALSSAAVVGGSATGPATTSMSSQVFPALLPPAAAMEGGTVAHGGPGGLGGVPSSMGMVESSGSSAGLSGFGMNSSFAFGAPGSSAFAQSSGLGLLGANLRGSMGGNSSSMGHLYAQGQPAAGGGGGGGQLSFPLGCSNPGSSSGGSSGSYAGAGMSAAAAAAAGAAAAGAGQGVGVSTAGDVSHLGDHHATSSFAAGGVMQLGGHSSFSASGGRLSRSMAATGAAAEQQHSGQDLNSNASSSSGSLPVQQQRGAEGAGAASGMYHGQPDSLQLRSAEDGLPSLPEDLSLSPPASLPAEHLLPQQLF